MNNINNKICHNDFCSNCVEKCWLDTKQISDPSTANTKIESDFSENDHLFCSLCETCLHSMANSASILKKGKRSKRHGQNTTFRNCFSFLQCTKGCKTEHKKEETSSSPYSTTKTPICGMTSTLPPLSLPTHDDTSMVTDRHNIMTCPVGIDTKPLPFPVTCQHLFPAYSSMPILVSEQNSVKEKDPQPSENKTNNIYKSDEENQQSSDLNDVLSPKSLMSINNEQIAMNLSVNDSKTCYYKGILKIFIEFLETSMQGNTICHSLTLPLQSFLPEFEWVRFDIPFGYEKTNEEQFCCFVFVMMKDIKRELWIGSTTAYVHEMRLGDCPDSSCLKIIPKLSVQCKQPAFKKTISLSGKNQFYCENENHNVSQLLSALTETKTKILREYNDMYSSQSNKERQFHDKKQGSNERVDNHNGDGGFYDDHPNE
ncbi:hypothetical protein RFI_16118, partial [Reticulomyxa filosa]